MAIRMILLLLAFICFTLSALGVQSTRVNLQSLGLAFWVVTLLVP